MSSAKPIICQAAVMYGYNEPLKLEQVRIDPPVGDQVRVRLVSTGICPSDVTLWRGKVRAESAAHKLPLVLGHEGAGIVESVGEKVTNLKPGDHVLTTYLPRCNDCLYCANPRVNICAKENFLTLASEATRTLVSSGEAFQGFGALGTFAEYLLVRQCQVERIDANLPHLEQLSIVTCGIGSGYFAVTGHARVAPGSTVAIWDLTAFGINVAYGAKQCGAKNIIAIDSNADEWRDLAKEFGVTELLNPAKVSVEAYLLEKYGGVDYAFDCNGAPEIAAAALKSLSPCGVFTFVAYTYDGSRVDVPVNEIVTGRSIGASLFGGVSTNEAYKEILDLYQAGKYPLEKQITHKFGGIEKINEAIKTVAEHKAVKAIVTF